MMMRDDRSRFGGLSIVWRVWKRTARYKGSEKANASSAQREGGDCHGAEKAVGGEKAAKKGSSRAVRLAPAKLHATLVTPFTGSRSRSTLRVRRLPEPAPVRFGRPVSANPHIAHHGAQSSLRRQETSLPPGCASIRPKESPRRPPRRLPMSRSICSPNSSVARQYHPL
jgi:hypothetical protein